MKTGGIVFCILSAVIGAGFASGREIMHFFSRYGAFSWALVCAAAMTMSLLMHRVMGRGGRGLAGLLPGSRWRIAGQVLTGFLLLCTGGGMAAAAGELAALTVPVHHARLLGLFVTLAACLLLSRRPLRILHFMGWLLIPALLLALALCARVPALPLPVPTPGIAACAEGVLGALSYAGLNVMLSAEILCEAGDRCTHRNRCRCAAWAGGAVGALLILGNAALLPHAATLQSASLPMVALLRVYGKAGYYLAALVLYLAVSTTLIAILRALCTLLRQYVSGKCAAALAALLTALIALCGFEEIVAHAYPALGFVCLLLLCRPIPGQADEV